MPLINVDAKQLEWVAATYLSKDKVAYKELTTDDYDMHSHNQSDLALPDRLTAKKFVFRLIFGGGAWSYANDPDFMGVSTSDKFWQHRIDLFYEKYYGLKAWQVANKRTVVNTGKLVMPTGRIYEFKMEKGKWPVNEILNYPVQGLGADLMAIARVSLYKRLKSERLNTRVVCTVHDSILLDSPTEEVAKVCQLISEVWRDIPRNFESLFKVKWDLPMKYEIEIGPTWGNMIKESEWLK